MYIYINYIDRLWRICIDDDFPQSPRRAITQRSLVSRGPEKVTTKNYIISLLLYFISIQYFFFIYSLFFTVSNLIYCLLEIPRKGSLGKKGITIIAANTATATCTLAEREKQLRTAISFIIINFFFIRIRIYYNFFFISLFKLSKKKKTALINALESLYILILGMVGIANFHIAFNNVSQYSHNTIHELQEGICIICI